MGFLSRTVHTVGGSGSLSDISGWGLSDIVVWAEVRGVEVAQREGAVGEGQSHGDPDAGFPQRAVRLGSRLLRRRHS